MDCQVLANYCARLHDTCGCVSHGWLIGGFGGEILCVACVLAAGTSDEGWVMLNLMGWGWGAEGDAKDTCAARIMRWGGVGFSHPLQIWLYRLERAKESAPWLPSAHRRPRRRRPPPPSPPPPPPPSSPPAAVFVATPRHHLCHPQPLPSPPPATVVAPPCHRNRCRPPLPPPPLSPPPATIVATLASVGAPRDIRRPPTDCRRPLPW